MQRRCNGLKIDKIREDKIKKFKSIKRCAEQDSAPAEPPLIELPLNTAGATHKVFAADVRHWREIYPAVDVDCQLRLMLGWLEANPKRRKTKDGIGRFINRWLANEQNRGSPFTRMPTGKPADRPESESERAARITWENGQKILAEMRAAEGEAI